MMIHLEQRSDPKNPWPKILLAGEPRADEKATMEGLLRQVEKGRFKKPTTQAISKEIHDPQRRCVLKWEG